MSEATEAKIFRALYAQPGSTMREIQKHGRFLFAPWVTLLRLEAAGEVRSTWEWSASPRQRLYWALPSNASGKAVAK